MLTYTNATDALTMARADAVTYRTDMVVLHRLVGDVHQWATCGEPFWRRRMPSTTDGWTQATVVKLDELEAFPLPKAVEQAIQACPSRRVVAARLRTFSVRLDCSICGVLARRVAARTAGDAEHEAEVRHRSGHSSSEKPTVFAVSRHTQPC